MAEAALLSDDDVRARLAAAPSVDAMRRAVLAHQLGTAVGPPRAHVGFEPHQQVFTVGRTEQGSFGFRAYETETDLDQIVCLWGPDGRVRLVIVGTALGPIRTGAIGAVAVDALARPDAGHLTVFGCGPQAWRQVWAIAAVRDLRRVVVHSRTPSRSADFARQVGIELGVQASVESDPRTAVRSADILVLATTSPTPVIEVDWIAPGTHVTSLGPKTVATHELPADIGAVAATIVTDSLAQARNYPPGPVLAVDRLHGLGEVLAGRAAGRRLRDDITVFVSVGLAGTELALAELLYEPTESHLWQGARA